ncbi:MULTISPECIES: PDZ domain-containing protein [Oceanobacillus]|uniref:PDZ domain-containing protein n=1 Tax=Oceanobacillus profundus TaxID=372463 RepID=A0A417YEX6_9BACI|nr:PDZ domain-containing protein [Oceanobacillus profundus]MDO6449528.1 PDZ domain-containing protein [Oceanobacillus profundus]RHW31230.1 PDZ domain-containing protein [Oceanobacillus profundus]
MAEAWLIELLKGIGRFFINPLVYWTILLLFIAGHRRIKQERMDYGVKIFDVFSEWKNTLGTSLISGLVISVITIGTGMVFSYEMILLLAIVTIILSITMRFSLLSPSYTIGLTFVILFILPLVLENQTIITDTELLLSAIDFTSIALLLGIMILVESILIHNVKRNATFPSIALSDRGAWVGQHRIKKLSLIPFFAMIPNGLIAPFAPWWPYFSIGEETYSVILIPFLIGFDYLAKGHFPVHAVQKISKFNTLLGIGILAIAAGSIFLPFLSIVAVILAIIGKEFLNYKYRVGDRLRRPFFGQLQDGLTIVGIIPATPAARLDIFIGETIVKVNGKRVATEEQFYKALQSTGAFFKLEILDDRGENRFVQGAFYEGDHHELGLLFASAPYRQKKSRISS